MMIYRYATSLTTRYQTIHRPLARSASPNKLGRLGVKFRDSILQGSLHQATWKKCITIKHDI